MKNLVMYRPTSIQSAMSDFDRVLESFFGDNPNLFGFAPASRLFAHSPAVDIKENENDYLLEMELPGFDEKNIEVNVDGSNLTIASRQEKNTEENQENFLLRERKASSFTRSFKLPENADHEAVSASFKNGVLSLRIMKKAEAQRRTVQINAA